MVGACTPEELAVTYCALGYEATILTHVDSEASQMGLVADQKADMLAQRPTPMNTTFKQRIEHARVAAAQ